MSTEPQPEVETLGWRDRFMWWNPITGVTAPWKPRAWHGTDEWHNHAWSVVVPFLGAFHFYYEPHFDRSGPPHYVDVPGCRCCEVDLR